MNKAHRNTIFVEEAQIVTHTPFEGEQFVLRVIAPECAQHAVAGSFAHIRCDNDIPMRRPLSIMRANAESGEVDFLYKIVGIGLSALSRARPGEKLSIMGPIGNGFSPDSARPRKLMLGGGVGIPPMVFLAEQLKRNSDGGDLLVMMGSEVPFPFEQQNSALEVTGLKSTINKTMALLEKAGITARLASQQNYAGCYQGFVTDMARDWLRASNDQQRALTEVFACGPEPMLQAAADVAREFGLPCQLCLEEYMACAVGGCAGCAVPVYGAAGTAMKRVCVDGPVFSAESIYPG